MSTSGPERVVLLLMPWIDQKDLIVSHDSRNLVLSPSLLKPHTAIAQVYQISVVLEGSGASLTQAYTVTMTISKQGMVHHFTCFVIFCSSLEDWTHVCPVGHDLLVMALNDQHRSCKPCFHNFVFVSTKAINQRFCALFYWLHLPLCSK